jgi:hypothetical protein
MTQYEDPNREAVGLEPAWVEGSGGSTRKAKAKADDAPKAKADDEPKAAPKDEPPKAKAK